MLTPVPDLRLPPEEHPPRKTGVRGIPVEEDRAQCRNRPPPEEYPPRKTGVRGIPLEEDLAQKRGRPPPQEYPPEEYPKMKYHVDKNSGARAHIYTMFAYWASEASERSERSRFLGGEVVRGTHGTGLVYIYIFKFLFSHF